MNPQRILVFQQRKSGESKIAGIRTHGEGMFTLEIVSIDAPLPPVIDDNDYIPEEITADLVLDFLKHPDLSHDLAVICARRKIPIVASGKKTAVKGVFAPFT